MARKPHAVERFEERLDEHTRPAEPGDRRYASRASGHNQSALRAEQEEETSRGISQAGFEHMTSGQWRGMIGGGAAGALVGAVIMAVVGAFVPIFDPLWVRLGLFALCGALAGAAAGGVYWGGRLPELEGETMDGDGRPSDGTTLRDPHTDSRGR